LMIAEQPEIHLNPRLQTELADLFCAIAETGRSVIVETHSEHLLLRLRRLIAEGAVGVEDVAVYFVERRGNSSTVRPVAIDAMGHIAAAEWPTGFVDDSLRNAVELAAAQRARSAGVKRGAD